MEERSNNKSGFLRRILNFIPRFIDFPSAIAGAVIMGLIVAAINFGHGWWPATTAALKQAAYTFLFGGILIRLLYRLVLAIPGKISALIISVISVSVVTILLVYLVHSMKGTPMPFESTLPTALLAPLGFSFLAYLKQKQK